MGSGEDSDGEGVISALPRSDVDLALDLISILCPETDRIDIRSIDGEPKSKARPRRGKQGHFYSPSDADERDLAWKMKTLRIDKRQGAVALGAIFFRSGFQRMDVDNMLKLVLDAGTAAGFWEDDHQVTAVLGIVEYDPDRPRTVIAIGDHQTTFVKPVRICPCCGTTFPLYSSDGSRRVYCSRECRYAAMRANKPAGPGQGRGPKRQPPPACQDCGTKIAKRTYLRCRACWLTARRQGIS